MNAITFGRLPDLPSREAGAHAARAFTPWRAANIEHLPDAIGIPLALTGQVRVETFAAGIPPIDRQEGRRLGGLPAFTELAARIPA